MNQSRSGSCWNETRWDTALALVWPGPFWDLASTLFGQLHGFSFFSSFSLLRSGHVKIAVSGLGIHEGTQRITAFGHTVSKRHFLCGFCNQLLGRMSVFIAASALPQFWGARHAGLGRGNQKYGEHDF